MPKRKPEKDILERRFTARPRWVKPQKQRAVFHRRDGKTHVHSVARAGRPRCPLRISAPLGGPTLLPTLYSTASGPRLRGWCPR